MKHINFTGYIIGLIMLVIALNLFFHWVGCLAWNCENEPEYFSRVNQMNCWREHPLSFAGYGDVYCSNDSHLFRAVCDCGNERGCHGGHLEEARK